MEKHVKFLENLLYFICLVNCLILTLIKLLKNVKIFSSQISMKEIIYLSIILFLFMLLSFLKNILFKFLQNKFFYYNMK